LECRFAASLDQFNPGCVDPLRHRLCVLVGQILPFDEQITPQDESLRGGRIEDVRAQINHGLRR
jgi:hypothetical protein